MTSNTQAEAPAAGARRASAPPMLHPALRRVGFWRALIELTLVGTGLALLFLPLAQIIPSPWSELISYLSLVFYVMAAWRLEPGAGGFARRALRIAAWLLIFGLLNSVIGWLMVALLPWKVSFFGTSADDLNLSPAFFLFSSLFLVSSLFLPARLLLAVWALGRRRLRWQLTFSYLLIGILTNFFIPLALFAYVAIVSLATAPPIFPPEDVAPRLAAALAPTVRRGVSPGQLDPLFAGLLSGETRLPLAEGEDVAELSDLSGGGVRRLTLLGRDGLVLAGAGEGAFAAGQLLGEQAEADLRLLIDTALSAGGCVQGHPASGPLADTAVCAVGDEAGAPQALLVVESNVNSSAQLGAAFGRVVTYTLLGYSLTLNIAIIVVLAIVPIALGIGYLLARRLTRRIERLTTATAGLAAGDLGQRVAIESQDEIGRLGDNFNTMASQLAERERALAEAAERAESLLRANKRLVADISHELRNPLATLRGYLEALEHEHGARLPAHDMRVIQAETQRLTGLIEDLFTLARVDAQQLPLSLGPVDAGAIMAHLAATLAPLARREREIEVVAQVAPDLPPARADQARLEQVIRNLAQNALRHTPPGGIIVLEARPAGAGGVELAVADTGLGIAAEDLPHVFERFYRGDSSRARETGGAGLGLALVRELVTAMGGSVAVESTPGRGSRFTVTLAASS